MCYKNIRPTAVCFLFGLLTVKADYPFRNTSLPYDTRVEDIVKRLSVDELTQQLSRGGGGYDGSPTLPIDRLGIETYFWGTECIHGEIHGASTSFPISIGMAAAFNPSLIKQVADAISTEVRAKHNFYIKQKQYTSSGMNCFSPVINIMRHPLWGRNQETYGEDPYLSGVYAANFVSGLRGDHPRYYRANAVCKHFDAYGGPEDLPQSRLSFNAKVSQLDLHTTFLPQFKACIDGGALGVMCSYNSVNGIPACANKELLTDILRTSWNFTGFVISDSGALEFMILNHWYVKSMEEAAVASIVAGVNLELHANQYYDGAFDWLSDAVQDGYITKDLLVERAKPLFYTRMRLGEFDPPEMNPYNKYNMSVVQSPAHRDLAILAAMQSFVLLKNDGFLPIKKKYGTVAIVGPFGDNAAQQMGDYSPEIDLHYLTTVKQGLSPLGHKVILAPGCDNTRCLHYNNSEVQAASEQADVTFVCLGTGPAIETENFDRENMLLPGYQPKLLQDVIQHTKGKVVVLLFSGGPMDVREAHTNPGVSAMMYCGFPAQSTGVALYKVVTMATKDANPAGRLPFTWYSSDAQVPDMVDYSMVNRTYRYFEGTPLYPFGYGLSYTQFKYTDLDLHPAKVKAGDNVTCSFNVTNIGSVPGTEVYQVYISWLNASVVTPLYQLVGFNRTMIDVGQTRRINVTITSKVMAVWLPVKHFVVEPGDMVVYVGGQMPKQKTQVPSNILRAMFKVV